MRGVMSALVLVCSSAAACWSPKRTGVGSTRETAIALAVSAGEQELVVDSPRSGTTHWYRVALHERSSVRAQVPEYDDRAFDIDVFDAAGNELGGSPATGDVLIRVAGETDPYRLHVRVTPQPLPQVRHPACNLKAIDTANPNCVGVVPCDPNNPDRENPACCLGCTKCEGKVVVIDGTNEGWLDIGSRHGITKHYRGRVTASIGGTWVEASLVLQRIERDRSKVWIGRDMALPTDHPGQPEHAVLAEPFECSKRRFHYR